MLTSILPDLEEFARLKSISAFFMLPAPLHESIVDGSSRSTDFDSDRDDLDRHGFAMRKLAKHYSQIGFRFLGKTRYMAMVPNNRQHPCWAPSTFQLARDSGFDFESIEEELEIHGLRAYCSKLVAVYVKLLEQVACEDFPLPLNAIAYDLNRSRRLLFNAGDCHGFLKPLPRLSSSEKQRYLHGENEASHPWSAAEYCKSLLSSTQKYWEKEPLYATPLRRIMNTLCYET